MRTVAFYVTLGALCAAPVLSCGGDDDDDDWTPMGGSGGAEGGGAGVASGGGSGGAEGGAAASGGAPDGAGAAGAPAAGAGTGGLAGSAGAAGAGNASPACTAYCAAVMDACTDADAQYTDQAECLDVCTALPEGDPGDTSGNSVACRAAHALLAAVDSAECSAAGPAGAGVCGENCDAYCVLIEAACPDEFGGPGTCMTTCADMAGADATTFSAPSGGDTLQCRLYHSALALSVDPAPHCMHASATPTAPCAP